MTEPARNTADLGRCLVTGAAGYLGGQLAADLTRRGYEVRGFDFKELDSLKESATCSEFIRGDIRNPDDVRAACEGVDTIFHTAAVIELLTFARKKIRDQVHAVNVGGVENVVRAARDAGVSRLIHTSSNNVTFGGPVIDGDESWPYAENAMDLYTQSKIRGEKIALAANETGGLLTCAIRPGGIFGPGERRFLPFLVEQCARGIFVVTIGREGAKSDNVYIDNLVAGQIEAALHLVEGSPVCGESYFISDGHPINYFDYFRPFVEGMGFRHPTIALPGSVVFGVTWVWELLHRFLPIPAPFLTRHEVLKVTTDHYSGIDKAKRDFGWEPHVDIEESTRRCVEYCRELLAARD